MMEKEKRQDEEDKETEADIDWENRMLCSDENCIGVIGSDGRCKECGKPYDSALNVTEHPNQAAADNDEAEADEAGFAAEDNTVAGEEEATEEDPDWETRILCSDGNCIGVIGSDGRCKECGKPSGG
jgi:hypothetical protein